MVVLAGGWGASACVQRVVEDCPLEACPPALLLQSGTPPAGVYPGVAAGLVEIDGERRHFECSQNAPCAVECVSADCSTTEVEVEAFYDDEGSLGDTEVRIGRRNDGEHACWLPEDIRVELEVGGVAFAPIALSLVSDDREACELPLGSIASLIPWREA